MRYDVIIVGAGVAGAATAWFCSERGLRVALVDKARFPRDKICTSTINPRSCGYLDELGVLGPLAQEDRLTQVRGIQTFSYEGDRFRGHYEPSHPYQSYGHTIPRHRLDKALFDRVASVPGVEYFEDLEIENVEVTAVDRIVVSGRQGKRPVQLEAALAVDAAGRGSPIARKHGLFEPWTDHQRFAVIAQYSGVPDADPFFNIGTNDAVGPGYFCVFPISGDLVITSLILTEPDYARAKPDPDAALEAFVASDWVLRDWFREAKKECEAVSFGPLAFRARAVTVDHVLMAGDTTGFYDPLTGEGITFAFRSAELAAEGAARLLAGEPWHDIAGWYELAVRAEKERPLEQAMQLQRMLGLRGAFNRFVTTLAATPEAANWLARSLGNLLPPEERSVEHFKAILQQQPAGATA